jgi:hypothetical protein
LVYPASRAALYGLKLCHGPYPLDGCQPFHPAYDCHGILAKTPEDIAVVTSIILGKRDLISSGGHWKDLRIGFINPEPWLLGAGDVKPNADYRRQFFSLAGSSLKGRKQGRICLPHLIPLQYISNTLFEQAHTTIGCGKQGFPSAQPYLSHTPAS